MARRHRAERAAVIGKPGSWCKAPRVWATEPRLAVVGLALPAAVGWSSATIAISLQSLQLRSSGAMARRHRAERAAEIGQPGSRSKAPRVWAAEPRLAVVGLALPAAVGRSSATIAISLQSLQLCSSIHECELLGVGLLLIGNCMQLRCSRAMAWRHRAERAAEVGQPGTRCKAPRVWATEPR